jgi:hypothetical protein
MITFTLLPRKVDVRLPKKKTVSLHAPAVRVDASGFTVQGSGFRVRV